MKMKLADNALQVGIITANMDRAHRFYAEVLGLPRVEPTTQLPGGGEMRRYRCGEVIIKLNSPGTKPGAQSPGGMHSAATGIRYLTLAVSNAREVYDDLTKAGCPIPMDIRESPERVVFFVQDPDGNNIEIFQDNRATP